MLRYIVKRFAATLLIILAVIFVVYGIVFISPSDPATIMLGMKATPEAVAKLNAELGYDQPFLTQVFTYIKNLVLYQDMGTSFKYNTDVWDEISIRFPKTLMLAGLTVAAQSVLAVFLGVLCVRYRGKWIDRFLSAMAGVLTAIPSYASGLLLLVVFSVWMGVTPIYGVKSMSGYILPTIALTLATVGYPLKMVRNTMLDVLQQDFIRTARAIGETETRVVYGYAVRNALLPIVTTIGYQFVGLLSGTIIIENVFSINGVGTLMVNAVIARDIPLMLGIIVVLTVIFCVVQLLMELTYLVLDPRVRAKYGI